MKTQLKMTDKYVIKLKKHFLKEVMVIGIISGLFIII